MYVQIKWSRVERIHSSFILTEALFIVVNLLIFIYSMELWNVLCVSYKMYEVMLKQFMKYSYESPHEKTCSNVWSVQSDQNLGCPYKTCMDPWHSIGKNINGSCHTKRTHEVPLSLAPLVGEPQRYMYIFLLFSSFNDVRVVDKWSSSVSLFAHKLKL